MPKGKRFTIFAHQSEYHLREELAEASREDIRSYDWHGWQYTLRQWLIALENLQVDHSFICIMDEQFNIHKSWKKE